MDKILRVWQKCELLTERVLTLNPQTNTIGVAIKVDRPKKKLFGKRCGIYAHVGWYNGRWHVFYIGMTMTDIWNRDYNHLSSFLGKINSESSGPSYWRFMVHRGVATIPIKVFFIDVPKAQVRALEKESIDYFNPFINAQWDCLQDTLRSE
jgi:hypothetical protein